MLKLMVPFYLFVNNSVTSTTITYVITKKTISIVKPDGTSTISSVIDVTSSSIYANRFFWQTPRYTSGSLFLQCPYLYISPELPQSTTSCTTSCPFLCGGWDGCTGYCNTTLIKVSKYSVELYKWNVHIRLFTKFFT